MEKAFIMITATKYREQVQAEFDALPEEYLPFALQIMRSFRESIALKPAAASLCQGWKEAKQNNIFPAETLWDDIDVE